MRYIKPFNENKDNFVDELKDFCETSLVYLLDDGYNVSLYIKDKVKYPEKNHVIVSLDLTPENQATIATYQKFYWDDVKNYYIPFLQLLVRRYKFLPYLDDTAHVYVFFNTISGFRYLSFDKVINDKTGLDCLIWGINLKILDKI